MTKEDLRFPLTPWPPTVVEPVPVEHRRVGLVHGEWLSYDPPTDLRDMPPELHLRGLLDLPLDDAEAVVGFLDTYGVIGRPEPSLLPWTADVPDSPLSDRLIHVGEAVLYLATARALVRHWLAYLEGTPLAEAWGSFGVLHDEQAWTYFVECLNGGLSAFTVRVERPFPELADHGDHYVQGRPRAGLYSALCLQLLNQIVEDLPVRRCQNETCRRAFVRQVGGAKHGQYRTEGTLLYCQPSCANSQWQRENRRRKRAERMIQP